LLASRWLSARRARRDGTVAGGNAEVRTYKVTLRLADCASGEAALIEKALLVS